MNDPITTQRDVKHQANQGLDIVLAFFVIRDIVIIASLNLASVFVIFYIWKHWLPKTSHYNPLTIHMIALFILMIICFTISASLARKNRWFHLLFVAIGIWIVDCFGWFYLNDSRFSIYLFDRIFLIAIPMLIGGSLFYVFKKKSNQSSLPS